MQRQPGPNMFCHFVCKYFDYPRERERERKQFVHITRHVAMMAGDRDENIN